MHIHRAGHSFLIKAALLLTAVITFAVRLAPPRLRMTIAVLAASLYGALLLFFRVPHRRASYNPHLVLAPSDGRIIAFERMAKSDKGGDIHRISIYLSLADAHLATAPVSGKIVDTRYHPGRYLLAFHPKASELNEHQTITIETVRGEQLQMRLIAGFIARRICSYVETGKTVVQGDEVGFIKFGSRVELSLPASWQVVAHEGQHVQVGVTPIARIL